MNRGGWESKNTCATGELEVCSCVRVRLDCAKPLVRHLNISARVKQNVNLPSESDGDQPRFASSELKLQTVGL